MKACILLLVVFVAATSSSVLAKPDFSGTTIVAEPGEPVAGDLVTFTVRLTNRGDQDAPDAEVTVDLPGEGMFVDAAGLEKLTIDLVERRLNGRATLPAGGEHTFRFRVLAPRDAAGNLLSPAVRVSALWLQADYYAHGQVEIGTPARHDGVKLGAFRITPAGLAVLAVLALYPILLVVLRRSPAGVAAIVIAIGFWTIFAVMAYRDWRSINEWSATSCRILDTRLRGETTSTPVRTGVRRSPNDNTAYASVLALQYTVDDRMVVSSGFDTGSRLAVGGLGGAVAQLAKWPIGATVPCWYDPEQPEDVVVIRGFGGAYVFALFPVPVFLLGLWMVRRNVRRRGLAQVRPALR